MSFRFDPIDLADYPRREHFEHFYEMNLTYSATVLVDITDLIAATKKRSFRIYPTQIWLLSEVVNRIPAFRMSVDPDGALGVFDKLEPLFTVFNETTQTFSGIWTPHSSDFGMFHDAAVAAMDKFNTGHYSPQSDVPINVLHISSIPWLDFTSFNLNMPSQYTLPIFTIGRHIETAGRIEMPLAIQVHHAVCDGYHVGQFVQDLRELVADWQHWLPATDPAKV